MEVRKAQLGTICLIVPRSPAILEAAGEPVVQSEGCLWLQEQKAGTTWVLKLSGQILSWAAAGGWAQSNCLQTSATRRNQDLEEEKSVVCLCGHVCSSLGTMTACLLGGWLEGWTESARQICRNLMGDPVVSIYHVFVYLWMQPLAGQ